jgi:hypothetical protein
MADYAKRPLTGAANGQGILVAATANPGTTINTSVASIVDMEELWIYATNNHTANVALTIQWAGTAGSQFIQLTVPFKQGLYLIVPGLVLQNSLVTRAFAATPNVITLFGWVNRITG